MKEFNELKVAELRNLSAIKAKAAGLPTTEIRQRWNKQQCLEYLDGNPITPASAPPAAVTFAEPITDETSGNHVADELEAEDVPADTGTIDNQILQAENLKANNSLSPQHLHDLQKSGLTDETIEQAGFVSLRPCDIDRETGVHSLPVLSTYRIPFDAGYSRFRLFYGDDVPASTKWPKYIQKAGQPNRLYIPFMLVPLLKDLSRPLYISMTYPTKAIMLSDHAWARHIQSGRFFRNERFRNNLA